jgi:hypothetical protein
MSALPSFSRRRLATAASAPRAASFLSRAGWLAGGVEAHGHRHQLLDDRLVGGNSGDVGDVRGQAARRGKAVTAAVAG